MTFLVPFPHPWAIRNVPPKIGGCKQGQGETVFFQIRKLNLGKEEGHTKEKHM